jgi:hypothetical protein
MHDVLSSVELWKGLRIATTLEMYTISQAKKQLPIWAVYRLVTKFALFWGDYRIRFLILLLADCHDAKN